MYNNNPRGMHDRRFHYMLQKKKDTMCVLRAFEFLSSVLCN